MGGGNTAANDGGSGDATPKDKKESVAGKKQPMMVVAVMPHQKTRRKVLVAKSYHIDTETRRMLFHGSPSLKGSATSSKVMSKIAQMQDRQTCLSRQQRRWLSLWGGPTSMVVTSDWQ